ncbi:MAG: RNA methyltransferase [Muribaculaceae bacterium]|nr:RNA methyltransferase [Muribaculaceae bacterium]
MSDNRFKMVAKTFQGLEDVLRDELLDLGAENVELGTRMVSFEGDNEMLYKANLCCRTALRILKPIVMFTADSTDELYDKIRELPWEQYMDSSTTFSIDSTVYGEDFTHSKFVTYRVKDGIVDHFRDLDGSRPSIRVEGADLLFNVHIAGNRVTISLDSSGEPLYKRGYRVEQTDAPINEVLAAGIILKTGWNGDTDFLDPMCGSGTFLIEAALIAANINPGIYRESFAFEKWKDFDKELFEEIYNDDSEERDFNYKIFGGDKDPEAIAVARKNIRSARVEEMIELSCRDLTEWKADTAEGIIVTNPPYGERLRPGNLDMLYKDIGSTLKNNFPGWHAWIIGYQEEQMKQIGLKPSVKIPLFNGKLECSLREYVMFDGSYSDFRADGGSVESKASEKKKTEGPRKVRHISDDEWKKESGKYSFGDKLKKNKAGRNDRHEFNRNNRKGGSGNDRSDNNDRKENRPFTKKPRFDNDRFDDRGKERRDFNRNDRGERKKFGDRRDSGPKSNITYNPANSRGPRLPESSERVINPVHLRKRKNRKPTEEDYD